MANVWTFISVGTLQGQISDSDIRNVFAISGGRGRCLHLISLSEEVKKRVSGESRCTLVVSRHPFATRIVCLFPFFLVV